MKRIPVLYYRANTYGMTIMENMVVTRIKCSANEDYAVLLLRSTEPAYHEGRGQRKFTVNVCLDRIVYPNMFPAPWRSKYAVLDTPGNRAKLAEMQAILTADKSVPRDDEKLQAISNSLEDIPLPELTANQVVVLTAKKVRSARTD